MFYRSKAAPLALALLALQGCASDFPELVRARAPEQGVTEIKATYRAGITSISSQAFIPGALSGRSAIQSFRCRRTGVSIDLKFATAADSEMQRKLCSSALSAAIFTRNHMKPVKLDYRIFLPASGVQLDRKWMSFSPPGRKVLTLAVPYFEEYEKTASVLTDTVAHETFHVAGFLNRLTNAGNEEIAYYFGICANFSNNHSLSLWDLPGAAFDQPEAGEVAAESSQAGYAVRLQVAQFMREGKLETTGPRTQAFLERCQSVLGQFDSGAKR